MQNQEEIDPVLVERFAHGNGTVFVGAGISLGSRLPSWSALMKPLRIDLGDQVSPDASVLEVAELYEVKHNRSVLVRYLKESLGDVRFQLTKTHELIVMLPVQRIYTTNFDNLLEQASQKKQINRNVIFNASHVGFADTSTLSIVKLHGDLSDPESIVVSGRDYYSYFGRNPAVVDLLKVELQTHTVLFMGYSFSDPNLRTILGSAAGQSGAVRPLLYSLQFNPTDLMVQAMNARGVKVIKLNAQPGTAEADQALEDWLRRFHQSLVARERRKTTLSTPVVGIRDLAPPALRKNAVRRMGVLERIKTGLQSDFRVVMVKGEPGIGKTQLVAEAAADSIHPSGIYMRDQVFEKTVWIRSIAEAGKTGHTLERILDMIASGANAHFTGKCGAGLRTKQADINAVLQQRRLLIVIEDLSDPSCDIGRSNRSPAFQSDNKQSEQYEEVRKWLENAGPYANPKSRIVVTSRNAIVAGFVVEIPKMKSEEALELISEHARIIMLERVWPSFGDKAKKDVLKISTGNPQAIKWALGRCNCVSGKEWLESQAKNEPPEKIDSVFNLLMCAVMEMLCSELGKEDAGSGEASPTACDVITAMMVFPSEEWIEASLLAPAVRKDFHSVTVRGALRRRLCSCVHAGLLEYDERKDAYLMHRTTSDVLQGLERQNKFIERTKLNEARKRLTEYLLNVLEEVIPNHLISDKYWNALVRDEMTKVDPYWPTIASLLQSECECKAKEGRPFLEGCALLLPHYMDSRFLNKQRLEFIQKALECMDNDAHTQALLHIDALAWTFIEENKHKDARRHIQQGLDMLKNGERRDLQALACAWHARLHASENKPIDARSKIAQARKHAHSCRDKYWIQARVAMIAGDVELMNGNPMMAIKRYKEAARKADLYGGEGDGYQTNPRIGLALMATLKENREAGVDKDKEQNKEKDKERKERETNTIEEARQRFTKLVNNEHISTGRLYGKYGLALVAAHEKASAEAIRQLEQVMTEVRLSGSGNVLLTLIEKSYNEIRQGAPATA